MFNHNLYKLAKISLSLIWFLFILKLLIIPNQTCLFLDKIKYIDKFIHFLLFAILNFFIIKTLKEFIVGFYKIALYGLLLSLFYGIITEYLQIYIPNRTASFFDFIFDFLGALSVALIYIFIKRKRPKLLMHICCVGCGIFVSKELKKQYNISLFFYNPNIFPESEARKRLEEAKKIARKFAIQLFVGEYNHQKWLKKIKGYENEKEKGKRCEICYLDRLETSAKFAKKKNMDYFSTTLSTSPHKVFKIIQKQGNELARKYKIKFLDKDFKKNNGFKKSCEISKDLKLYRQNYCGCEFSLRDRNIKK